MLPAASVEEEFDALANASRWDFRQDNDLQQRLNDAALAIPAARRTAHILKTAATRPAAGFELGTLLSTLAASDDAVVHELVSQADAGNTTLLAGYLSGRTGNGDPGAFDDFLDSPQSSALDDASRLAVSVRGPRTDRGWQRVERLVQDMPPVLGTRGLIGWHSGLAPQRLGSLLSGWMTRLGSQADYNAVIDFTGMALHQQPPWNAEIDPTVSRLVAARAQYPDVANEEWDWAQLARRQLGQQPAELLETLLALAGKGGYRPYGAEEEQLLRDTIEKTGPDGWRKTMERITPSPRMQAVFNSWLADAVDLAVAKEWVGTDLARARILARVAETGGDKIRPAARFLLTDFGADDEVSAALGMTYLTGGYAGRCQAQISQLTGWTSDPAEPPEVKIWAQTLIARLTAERGRALQNEAEYGR